MILYKILCALFVAAVLAGCASETCERCEPVRVGTYNIRTTQWQADAGTPNAWTNRRESVVALIRKMDLDVFGLQEVMPDQADFFAAALPDYSFVGEHRGEDRVSDEASPVAYRKSRFMAVSFAGSRPRLDRIERIGCRCMLADEVGL